MVHIDDAFEAHWVEIDIHELFEGLPELTLDPDDDGEDEADAAPDAPRACGGDHLGGGAQPR